MSDLIIILDDQISGSGPWAWGISVTGKSGIASTEDEKSALKDHVFKRIIIVIPGQNVGIKLHTLDSLPPKKIRQAAGFSIEDELASSLADNHVALDDNAPRLAVVSKGFMDEVLAELARYGLSADIMCADYDSFSVADSFTYQNRVIRRAGNGLGFAVETQLAPAILDAGQAIPLTIDSTRFLEKIATSLQSGHEPINLLQGQYAQRAGLGFGKYKRSLWLAAALVLAFTLVNIGKGVVLTRKTNALHAQINAIYTDIFPDKPVPKNPVAAVLQAQSQLGKGGNRFLHLSAIMANSVQQVKDVEISSLRYDDKNGHLLLSIQYSGFDDVEKLKRAVVDNGGIFEESGTRQNTDGVRGNAVLGLAQ